jgi:hypothetical protein
MESSLPQKRQRSIWSDYGRLRLTMSIPVRPKVRTHYTLFCSLWADSSLVFTLQIPPKKYPQYTARADVTHPSTFGGSCRQIERVWVFISFPSQKNADRSFHFCSLTETNTARLVFTDIKETILRNAWTQGF